ncbi:TrkH family potassium uptake protein [Thalassospira sp.]|uniref:TrkH family potassium uptake protein n=1 Tax=Thalassospira sp. TaxID=1912094 RepID=UPI0027324A70|nr:TrkH family potassium uptake protein [Thalassospira sp.]MDP2700228.1 TrkH family potassium uptake protein [Thalassospira sp.]
MVIIIGGAMVVPAMVDLYYDNADWQIFAQAAAITIGLGGMVCLACRSDIGPRVSPRQGYVLTAFSWIAVSVTGALPLWFSSLDLSFTDAVFETVSGLTTTGSTVLTGLDDMAPGLLVWRSLLQWLGGIGIIVTALALLPMMRVGGMQLFQMESSDRSEKLSPRIREMCLQIVMIYGILSLICMVLYRVFGMSWFDAINHGMSTLATGGYSTSDMSFAKFESSLALHWVGTVFMIAGALPFTAYAVLVRKRSFAPMMHNTQIRLLLLIITFFTALLTIRLLHISDDGFLRSVTMAAFNLVSVITTTGFASGDYLEWGPAAIMLFFFATFIGGCAGSTSGGFKMFRLYVVFSGLRAHFTRLRSPSAVVVSHIDNHEITSDIYNAVTVYVFFLAISYIGVSVALGLAGLDLVTAMSAAATALANVGPGLGPVVGPAGNFQPLPDSAKWVLNVAMVLGRLEFETLLVLLLPAFWRD